MQIFMLRGFLLIALRNINRNRLFSLINITGLSIGLACVFMILLFVRDEFSYDRFHENGERIFRVALHRIYPDTEVDYPIVPHSLGHTMKEDFPEIEACTRLFLGVGEVPFTYGDKTFNERGVMLADSNFFDMFSISLLKGDPGNILRNPNEMILTESTARKYFGEAEAMGRSLSTPNGEVMVSGICEDVPKQSHLAFDFLGPIHLLPLFQQPNYVAFSTFTYIRLRDQRDAAVIEKRMPDLVRKYAAGQIQAMMGISYDDYISAGNGYEYFLQPLRDIHLHSDMDGEIKPNGNYALVMISLSIAIFILLLACINFINLSTARSTDRAREVGIRKAAGSDRGLLIRQFIMESVLITFVSLVISFLITELALPEFNRLSGKEITMDYFDSFTIPVFLGFTLLVGILSGSYPALVLSGFKPAEVLKGKFTHSPRGTMIRNVLVTFQFTISIFLVAFTLLVYWQLRFLMNRDLGFKQENVIVLEGFVPADARESFKQEVVKLTDVIGTASASTEVTGGYYSGFMIQVEEFGSEVITTRFIVVDDDFLGTLEIPVLEGRGFSRDFNDSMNVIVNRTAVREYNLSEPIGTRLLEPVDTGGGTMIREFSIIGVVEDFHYNSLHQDLNSFVLQSTSGPNGFAQLLYIHHRAADVAELLDRLEVMWTRFFPGQPFQYYFLDERIARMYANDRTSGRLFSVFSLLGIIIACVGLFGLAAYTTDLKTKEIGVHKVAGARTGQVVWRLSLSFNRLILLSCLVSIPAAVWAMKEWLDNFAYRVEIPLWIFIVSCLIAFGVAFLTISYHSFRLANKNPAETLHYE